MSSWAYDFKVNGIYYNVVGNDSVEVTRESSGISYYYSPTTYRGAVNIPEDPKNIAIIAGDCWYKYDVWKHDGQYSTIDITPIKPGELTISYQIDDRRYETIVEYRVRR